MKKFVLVIAVVSLGSLGFVTAVRADGIREGNWSMTMVIKMGGMGQEGADATREMENMSDEDKAMMKQMMGGMNMQMGGGAPGITTTTTECITNQDPVPDRDGDEDCQKTHTLEGNTVNFEVICPDSKSTGKMTYSGDSMSGEIKSQQMETGKMTDVTIEISGQYAGPCS